MYSDRMKVRLRARAPAAFNVCPRHQTRSMTRSVVTVNSAPIVRAAMTDLRTCLQAVASVVIRERPLAPYVPSAVGGLVARRTLAGPPRHDDRRVPERIAAVQEAPGIALRADATKPRRQIDRAIANRVFELSLHAARDCFGIAQAHGGVDARNEVIETVDHHNQYIEQRRLRCADATAARQKIVA